MSLEKIQAEVINQVEEKDNLFHELLKECDIILNDILMQYPIDINSLAKYLPKDIIGRRLSDKIIHLKYNIESMKNVESATIDHVEKIEQALILVLDYFKNPTEDFPTNSDIKVPDKIVQIKKKLLVIESLENEFHHTYAKSCKDFLSAKFKASKDTDSKKDIKQSAALYDAIVTHMPYEFMLKIKRLNDDSNEILTFGQMAKEYKIAKSSIGNLRTQNEILKSDNKVLKNVAKVLTELRKNQVKSESYEKEIKKLEGKLEFEEDASKNQIQELINSYTEAYEMVNINLQKNNANLLSLGISTEEDYHSKYKKNQVNLAQNEMELGKTEKLILTYEEILREVSNLKRIYSSKN